MIKRRNKVKEGREKCSGEGGKSEEGLTSFDISSYFGPMACRESLRVAATCLAFCSQMAACGMSVACHMLPHHHLKLIHHYFG